MNEFQHEAGAAFPLRESEEVPKYAVLGSDMDTKGILPANSVTVTIAGWGGGREKELTLSVPLEMHQRSDGKQMPDRDTIRVSLEGGEGRVVHSKRLGIYEVIDVFGKGPAQTERTRYILGEAPRVGIERDGKKKERFMYHSVEPGTGLSARAVALIERRNGGGGEFPVDQLAVTPVKYPGVNVSAKFSAALPDWVRFEGKAAAAPAKKASTPNGGEGEQASSVREAVAKPPIQKEASKPPFAVDEDQMKSLVEKVRDSLRIRKEASVRSSSDGTWTIDLPITDEIRREFFFGQARPRYVGRLTAQGVQRTLEKPGARKGTLSSLSHKNGRLVTGSENVAFEVTGSGGATVLTVEGKGDELVQLLPLLSNALQKVPRAVR